MAWIKNYVIVLIFNICIFVPNVKSSKKNWIRAGQKKYTQISVDDNKEISGTIREKAKCKTKENRHTLSNCTGIMIRHSKPSIDSKNTHR